MTNHSRWLSKLLHPSSQSAPTANRFLSPGTSSVRSAATSSEPAESLDSILAPETIFPTLQNSNTAMDLYDQLIDLNQYDLAMTVLSMHIKAEGNDAD